MKRKFRKLTGFLVIAALLYTQWAVAAYACPLQFNASSGDMETVSAIDHETNDCDPASPALCKKHCENAAQNFNDTPSTPIFFAVETGGVVTPSTITFSTIQSRVFPAFLSHATSPPHSIRNCCFRI